MADNERTKMRGAHLFRYDFSAQEGVSYKSALASPATWTAQTHLVFPKSRPLAVVCWRQLLHF